MGNGYPRVQTDELDVFRDQLQQMSDRISELQRPSGSQTAKALKQLQDLVNGLLNQVNVSAAGNVTAGGTVAGVNGNFTSQLKSVGAYNTDVSLLAGARQTVWQHNSGVYGFAPSTIETKTDLGQVPFSAADARAVQPYVFHYRAQLAIRDDPENPSYDPDYVVPWEIGLMAEHLIAHNMGCFVFWDDDGVTPRGINYDLFGAIVPLVILADVEERMVAAGL